MDNKTYLDNANARDRAEWKSADANSVPPSNGVEPIKMLYVKHKLGNNYLSANGTGDENMKRDILTGEIAKLIVRQPKLIGRLLYKHRLKVPSSNNRSQLVVAVSDGLYSNKKFAEDIAIAIAKNRGSDGTFSAEGDKGDPAAVLQGAASLVKGLGDLFGGKKKAKAATAQAAAEAARDKAAAQKALAEAAKAHAAGAGMKDNMKLYIGLAVGAGILVGVGVWYFKYRKP